MLPYSYNQMGWLPDRVEIRCKNDGFRGDHTPTSKLRAITKNFYNQKPELHSNTYLNSNIYTGLYK